MDTRASAIVTMIENARFRPVRLRQGYDMGEVDNLLANVQSGYASGQGGPHLMHGARFSVVRFREGYDMADVDTFLELIRGVADGSVEPTS